MAKSYDLAHTEFIKIIMILGILASYTSSSMSVDLQHGRCGTTVAWEERGVTTTTMNSGSSPEVSSQECSATVHRGGDGMTSKR